MDSSGPPPFPESRRFRAYHERESDSSRRQSRSQNLPESQDRPGEGPPSPARLGARRVTFDPVPETVSTSSTSSSRSPSKSGSRSQVGSDRSTGSPTRSSPVKEKRTSTWPLPALQSIIPKLPLPGRKSGSRSSSVSRSRSISPIASPGKSSLKPTLAQRHSQQAKLGLERLQAPPELKSVKGSEREKWDEEFKEILRDNVDVLLRTSEPLPGSDEARERKEWNERAQKAGMEKIKAKKAAAAAAAERDSPSKKRPRQNSPFNGHSDDEGELGDSDGSDSEGRRHAPSPNKRPRLLSTKGKIPPTVPLEKLAPQPIRLQFTAHPPGERSDGWYIHHFRSLYRSIERFAQKYFVVRDLNVDEDGEILDPWLGEGLNGGEWVTWVESVAEVAGDGGDRGWDGILRDGVQRKNLVMGILGKVLKAKVWDCDLFGANEEQKELIFGIERAFLSGDGFQRTALRSQTTRSILSHSPTTPLFYASVATLTAQVSLLLHPLSSYLYSLPPTSESQKIPNIQDQYQALHNIMSTAAYLSLCIRTSETIFQFVPSGTGETWSNEEHVCLDLEGYGASKRQVFDKYSLEHDRWEEKRKKAQRLIDRLTDAGREDSRQFKTATIALETILKEKPKDPDMTHRPLVRISVWPAIRRYKPGSDDDDKAAAKGKVKALAERDGMRIFGISMAGVVVHFVEKDRDWLEAGKDLGAWVEEKRGIFGRTERGWGVGGAATLAAGAVVAAGLALWGEALGDVGLDIGEGVAALVDYVR